MLWENITQIDLEERCRLRRMIEQGFLVTKIARHLGRDRRTIQRELGRNSTARGEYKYPFWSSLIFYPVSVIFDKCVCQDDEFCIIVTMAIFDGFPAAFMDWYFPAISGLYRAATRAGM